jgi:hypothetical protein
MKLTFGIHKGKELEDVPEEYLCWLAKPTRYYKSQHSPEVAFKVPWAITVEARRIVESRGYKIIGERVEK